MIQHFPVAKAQLDVSQFSVLNNLVFLYYTRISYYTKYNPLFLNYTLRYVATILKHPVAASNCFCPTCAVLDARLHRSLLHNLTSSPCAWLAGQPQFYGSWQTSCMLVRCCVLQIKLDEVLCFIDFDSYRRVSTFVQTSVLIFSVSIYLNQRCFAVKSELQVTTWRFVALFTVHA